MTSLEFAYTPGLISPSSTAEWLQLLLGVACKGALLLLLAGAVLRGLRKASASVRHLIGSLALGGLLALPLLEVLLPGWQLPLFPALRPPVAAAVEETATVPASAATTDAEATTEGLTIGVDASAEAPHEASGASAEDAALAVALDAAAGTTADGLTSAELAATESAAAKENSENHLEGTVSSGASSAQAEPTNNNFDPAALPGLPPYKLPTLDGGLAASGDRAGTTASFWRAFPWGATLLGLWAAGVLAVLGKMLIGALSIARLVRRAQPLKEAAWVALAESVAAQLGVSERGRLLISEEVAMPLTWGARRPVILLPEAANRWTTQCRRIVLLHEMSHIKRRDCLTQTLAQLACALHWFNPLVWLVTRQLRVERELACDDQVLEIGTRASDYAGYLVEIARAFKAGKAASAFAAPMTTVGMACSQLESRVRAILNPHLRRRSLNRLRVAVAALLTCALLVPLSIIKPAGVVAAQLAEKLSPSASPGAVTNGEKSAENRAFLPPSSTEATARLAQAVVMPESAGQGAAAAVHLIKEQINVEAETAAPIVASPTLGELLQAIEGQAGSAAGTGQGGEQTRKQGDAKPFDPATPQRSRRFRNVVITPEFLEAVRRMGFGQVSDSQLLQLRLYNITEEFVQQARGWGFDKLSVQQVIELKLAGVTSEYMQSLKRLGIERPRLTQLISLKRHNVTPEFAEEMRRAGYANLSAEQLLSLRVHGINQQFVQEVESWGWGKLSLKELMQVRTHKLTPAFAAEVRAMGFDHVALAKLVSLRVHAITADHVREVRALGFAELTVEQLIQMKVHGVTPDYVRKMRAAGYRHMTVKQLIDYKQSGVDEILLRNSR